MQTPPQLSMNFGGSAENAVGMKKTAGKSDRGLSAGSDHGGVRKHDCVKSPPAWVTRGEKPELAVADSTRGTARRRTSISLVSSRVHFRYHTVDK